MATQKKNEVKSHADDGNSESTIDAMPTKELFIDMLTRDIALIPAIIDLVDNCADGAKKLRGDESLKGLWARLNISSEEFRIADNCGGIDVETARSYAFRFGRAAGAPSVKHSVGQFGVGMKRAIFKMGRNFRVESITTKSRFVVDVNVNDWAQLPEWKFHFEELVEGKTQDGNKVGTIVSVTSLQADVAEVFGLTTFETELRNELKATLQDPIARGLAVTLNGIPVNAEPMTMLSNEQLAPAYKKLVYKKMGKPVTVRLYCGLGRSGSRSDERAEAGWHVFCNGRLILEGDKSSVTGWREELDEVSIPGFHPQYNHLRGFAYFDSDDPSRLPWNTTKTGLNTDSAVYRAVKLEMMTLMRPVVDFLNRLKDEKQNKQDAEEKGPLESILEDAKPTPVSTVATRSLFVMPALKEKSKPSGPTMQKIQYEAPLDDVLAVKKAIKATSFKEVGEKTFRYFYNAEVDE